MNESLLISFEEAGRLLGGLHPNTLRQRKAGANSFFARPARRRDDVCVVAVAVDDGHRFLQ